MPVAYTFLADTELVIGLRRSIRIGSDFDFWNIVIQVVTELIPTHIVRIYIKIGASILVELLNTEKK